MTYDQFVELMNLAVYAQGTRWVMRRGTSIEDSNLNNNAAFDAEQSLVMTGNLDAQI
jgi:hypothetical protein